MADTTVPSIRVLLGDDHRIVREGLKQVLADAPEVQVVAEAASSLSDWGMKGIATDGMPKKQAFLSPTRRFQRGFGAIFCFYPAFRRNTAMRLRFQARQTSVHSPETLRRPRSENWRNPITDLMMPNTGSTVCLRSA